MQQFGFNTSFLPVPGSHPPPSQPLPFPPYVRCSPSFHITPKKTKTYTKSYKMPIQLVLVRFGKMHILHNYALLCIILNFLPLSEAIPIISQKSQEYYYKCILGKVNSLHYKYVPYRIKIFQFRVKKSKMQSSETPRKVVFRRFCVFMHNYAYF